MQPYSIGSRYHEGPRAAEDNETGSEAFLRCGWRGVDGMDHRRLLWLSFDEIEGLGVRSPHRSSTMDVASEGISHLPRPLVFMSLDEGWSDWSFTARALAMIYDDVSKLLDKTESVAASTQ